MVETSTLAEPDAAIALQRLMEGNARYRRGEAGNAANLAERRSACAEAQHPVAAVLGCSDSRVPPQLVFDQAPGDLFTTRVAGHVASGAVTASIEFAVQELGVPLVLVLGHSRCGAVAACLLDEVASAEGKLGDLLEAIAPAVDRARRTPGDLLERAIRFNVEHVVEQLRSSEPILAPRVRSGRLRIVGGLYDLETGAVQLIS
jgi:carbonic anhydrase